MFHKHQQVSYNGTTWNINQATDYYVVLYNSVAGETTVFHKDFKYIQV